MCLPAADAVDDLVVAELVQLALALDHALTPGSEVFVTSINQVGPLDLINES